MFIGPVPELIVCLLIVWWANKRLTNRALKYVVIGIFATWGALQTFIIVLMLVSALIEWYDPNRF